MERLDETNDNAKKKVEKECENWNQGRNQILNRIIWYNLIKKNRISFYI